jgi:hypothetical protein
MGKENEVTPAACELLFYALGNKSFGRVEERGNQKGNQKKIEIVYLPIENVLYM